MFTYLKKAGVTSYMIPLFCLPELIAKEGEER